MPTASEIFSQMIQVARDQHELGFTSAGSQFLTESESEKLKIFLASKKNQEKLLGVAYRTGDFWGVIHEVKPESDYTGTVGYFDESGFMMRFGYNLKADPEMYPMITNFCVGDVILLTMDGMERKKVRRLPLTDEDKMTVIEKIGRTFRT